MKSQLTIAALILASACSAGAQMVSSHASTLPTPEAAATEKAPPSFQVTNKPVVKVNDVVLTDRDLLREMLAMFPYARMHNGFPKDQVAQIRAGAMQMIVFEELVYQEAQRRKMTIAPERVTREENKFKQQFGSQAEFNQYLKEEMGGSEAKLKQGIRRSLLIETLLKQEVQDKSVVSAAQVRAYYDKNSKQYEHGETFSLQTISIIPPANANPGTLAETRKRAETFLAEAKKTKTYQEFGLLAEKFSDDDYRVNMGDRHTVAQEKLPAEVVKAARAMKAGEVSGLIQLGTAYTIIRLNAHNAPGKTKFEEARPEIATRLQKEKYEQLRVSLGKRLRQNAKIQEL